MSAASADPAFCAVVVVRGPSTTALLVRVPSARSCSSAARGHVRDTPTASEGALWQTFGQRRLGVAFKRQVLLGERCIADFFPPSVSS